MRSVRTTRCSASSWRWRRLRDGSGDEARAEILRRWGRVGLVSLAYGIVAAQSYPTFKYAIGHGHACVRLRVGGETIAMQHPQYA